MNNQTNRYEICLREGFSNCDDIAGFMLCDIEKFHSNKKDAIKAMREAQSSKPAFAQHMDPPRIAVWDSKVQEFVA